jgi:predicted dehydrogenase
MGKKIRIGIIGVGSYSIASHMPALQTQSDTAELVAICRQNRERLELAKKTLKN